MSPIEKRVKIAAFIVIIAVAAIVGGAYYYITLPSSEESVIKIGTLAPLTGASAANGWHLKRGIELAADQVNEEGGLLVGNTRYRIEVIFGDSECKLEIGTALVQRFIELDRIDFAVGHQLSSIAIACIDIYQSHKIPTILTNCGSSRIWKKVAENEMNYIFQLSPTSPDIAIPLAEMAVHYFEPTKVAMFNENTDAGRDMADYQKDWLAENAPEVEIVYDEYYEKGRTDFYANLMEMKHIGAEVLIGESPGIGAAALMEQYYELQIPMVIVSGGATSNTQEFIDEHSEEMEGSLLNNRWWPGPHTPLTLPMIEAFKNTYGMEPSSFAVQPYDAMLVLFDAIKRAGTLDKEKVAEAIEDGDVMAVWGYKQFTSLEEGHRCPTNTIICQIQGGTKVPVWPLELVDPSIGEFKPIPPWAWEG